MNMIWVQSHLKLRLMHSFGFKFLSFAAGFYVIVRIYQIIFLL